MSVGATCAVGQASMRSPALTHRRSAQLAERLFGVTVERADGRAPVWHPDVQFFALARDGRPKACFYLDPYSRPAGAARALLRPLRAPCTSRRLCGRRRVRWGRKRSACQSPCCCILRNSRETVLTLLNMTCERWCLGCAALPGW